MMLPTTGYPGTYYLVHLSQQTSHDHTTGATLSLRLTVGLLPGDALDVDHELAAVASLHLSLAVLVGPPGHHHLVALANGERSDLRTKKKKKKATVYSYKPSTAANPSRTTTVETLRPKVLVNSSSELDLKYYGGS